MIRAPPRSTRTDTLVPYTPLFRSHAALGSGAERVGNRPPAWSFEEFGGRQGAPDEVEGPAIAHQARLHPTGAPRRCCDHTKACGAGPRRSEEPRLNSSH